MLGLLSRNGDGTPTLAIGEHAAQLHLWRHDRRFFYAQMQEAVSAMKFASLSCWLRTQLLSERRKLRTNA